MMLPVLLALAAAAAAGGAGATAGETPPCCFTNSGYVGVCTVVPAEKETCADILAYLNNTFSTGKTYCNNTRLRGGWRSVPCPPANPSTAAVGAARPDASPAAATALQAGGAPTKR
jgi:hypothetical protein